MPLLLSIGAQKRLPFIRTYKGTLDIQQGLASTVEGFKEELSYRTVALVELLIGLKHQLKNT